MSNDESRDDDETCFRVLHTPKGLFDRPDRELTAEEKAHPLTFFGVTVEMRAERLKAMGFTRPPLSDEEKAEQRESVQQLRRLMTADETRYHRQQRRPRR